MNKIFLILLIVLSSSAYALSPIKALDKPSNNFIADGVFIGGDGQIRASQISNIRRAKIEHGERTVIDLKTVLGKIPYYSVDVNSTEKRIVVSVNISGSSSGYSTTYKPDNFKKLFTKSSHILSPVSFPTIDADFVVIEFPIKKNISVNVFHLENPARIILDSK